MKRGTIIWIVVGSLVLMGGCSGFRQYNGLVMTDEGITGAWSQVENVLQRRADLIPNLVNIVKGYAKHEREVFEHIADARKAWAGAKSVGEKVQANERMESGLARLMVIVEQYPNLKANENFRALQDELAGTENRISTERRRYVQMVQTYNTMVRRFPTNLIAGLAGFTRKDVYFKAKEGAEEVPNVQFE